MRNFKWPSGYKAAVCFSWDLDGEAAQYVRNPAQASNQTSELVQRSYGPEVGLYKILDLLEEFDLNATFYVPGYTANLHPEAFKSILERKHAVGLHGYMHETMDDLSDEQESEMFKKSVASIEKIMGRKPRIFRSPSFEINRRTPSLLLKHGVVSDSSLMGDDYPYVIDNPEGPLIELPVNWILDDAEFWGHTKANRQKPISDPDTVLKLWKREFEGLYNSSGIFVLTMHPFIMGRWVYVDAVKRLIKHILGFKGVWLASMDEVADYCSKNMNEPFMLHRKLPAPEPIEFKL